jgi:4-hydroxy-tetrahydrodipicolinate synthase
MRIGAIELPAWEDMLEYQLVEGVQSFVVGGTTGEGHLMVWSDQIDLIAHTVEQVGSRAAASYLCVNSYPAPALKT